MDTTSPPDLYRILGVAPSAAPHEVRRAYRLAVQQWHPDRCRAPDAADRMVEIQHAWRVLGNPVERASYDRSRPAEPAAYAADPDTWVRRTRRQVGQWLSQLGTPAPKQGPHGDTATVRVFIPLPQVFSGCVQSVVARIAHTCPACRGLSRRCPICLGTGQRFSYRHWRVRITPGIPDGGRLILRGQGHDGPRFSGPGNVVVEVRWHRPGIWRWDTDMARPVGVLRLSPSRRARGGRYRVRLPNGISGWLILPAGIQPGAKLQLPGIVWPPTPLNKSPSPLLVQVA